VLSEWWLILVELLTITVLKVCFLMCHRNPYEYAYLVNVKSWTISNNFGWNEWLIDYFFNVK
jgi:hypothetical protein